VDQRQPANLYDAAGIAMEGREVPGGWTHPRWPGRTDKKPVHPAAQINQIGGLPAVTESLRSSRISAARRAFSVAFYITQRDAASTWPDAGRQLGAA
jgi:hypothetical protein